MAITTIHPIYRTVLASVEYITDPSKTDDKLLVSSYACSPETADLDFAETAGYGTGWGKVKAQHLIQAFAPNEVDAKTAHEIGYRLAMKITGGKHQFILATHTSDRGLIHNHIIFNQVDFIDNKKFRGNIRAQREIARQNDELCKAYGLSVIDNLKGKGKPYYKTLPDDRPPSNKKVLMDDIDTLIPTVKAFEELLDKLKDKGYEIKNTGTYYSFKKADWQRYTRLKRLGYDYTEEGIKERIKNATAKGPSRIDNLPYASTKDPFLMMQKMQNPAYANKVALSELKKITAAHSFLNTHGIRSMEELEEKRSAWASEIKNMRKDIKALEDEIKDLSDTYKFLALRDKHNALYKEYKKTGFDQRFFNRHSAELMAYENACTGLKRKDISPTTKTSALASSLKELNIKHDAMMDTYHGLSDDLKELNASYKTIDEIILSKTATRDGKKDKIL